MMLTRSNNALPAKDEATRPADSRAQTPARAQRSALWAAAIILFLLHRAVITVATIHTIHRLHERLTWYRLIAADLKHWDAGWYIEIAQRGYFKLSETAFFPLYPMVLRGFHSLTGLSYVLAGTVVSSLFFVLSLYILGQLGNRLGGLKVALVAMSLLAFFPMSFFFDSMYAEALFLFLTLMAAYMSMQGKFWLAGLFAGLATLTRNTGVFMDLILFFDYLAYRQMGVRFWNKEWWKKLRLNILSLLLAPFGLVLYLLWSWRITGNPLAFLAAERLWGRHYNPPWKNWYETLKLAVDSHPTLSHYYLLEFASFSMVVLVLIFSLLYVRRSLNQIGWWLYTLTVTFVGSSEPSLRVKDYLLSFPRFVLMLFPVFLYLALPFRRKWLAVLLAFVFAYLLYRYAAAFTLGVWIA